MAFIGNSPTQGVITGGNIVDGSIESIDLATLTNIDINSGSIDGTVIGGVTPAAVTTTALVATTADINAGTIDGTTIGATTPASVAATTLSTTGAATFSGLVGIGGAATDGTFQVKGTGINTGITNVLIDASFADASNATGLTIGHRTDETTAVIAPRTATGNLAFYNYNGGWSETMRLTNTGNVGIGCTPASKLDIDISTDARGSFSSGIGEVGSGNFALQVTNSAGSALKPLGFRAEDIRFATGSSERLRIDASGALVLNNAGGDAQMYFGGTGGTTRMYLARSGGDALLWNVDSGAVRFGTNNAEVMRISSGNLLVGKSATSVAGQSNSIQSNTMVSASGPLFNHTSSAGILEFSNNKVSLRAYGATAGTGFLAFNVGGGGGSADSEAMRIDTSGNVGIGCTPGYTFEVRTNDTSVTPQQVIRQIGSGDAAIGFQIPSGANWYAGVDNSASDSFVIGRGLAVGTNVAMTLDVGGNLYVGNGYTTWQSNSFGVEGMGSGSYTITSHINGTPNGQPYSYFFYNNGVIGSITQSGTTGVAYNTSSDYRLKEDDVPMTGATERVKALRPINFAWKADGSRTDGFFAHEAQVVVPECATGTKDAMRDEEYEVTPAVEEVRDEGGNIITEAVAAVMGTRSVPDYQGIDQSKLVPLLTATIQELIARIEALEGA